MKSAIVLNFGPATVRIDAEEPYSGVLDVLAGWLGDRAPVEVARPDVRLLLSHGRAPGRRRHEMAWSRESGSGWWDGKAWDVVPALDATSQWQIHLHESRVIWFTRLLPDALTRWAHAHRFGREEILASAVLYGQILPAAQEALRAHGATLVHASAITVPSGAAVLVLGRGGAGKTSASTQLYIRKTQQWRYMSDDLAVVAADGTLYRSPVPLNIFPYNTERFPELWNLLARQMSPLDKAQWRTRRMLLGAAGVARRRSPFADYLGPAIATVVHVVELERDDVDEPILGIGNPESMASEARNVLAHELRRGFDGFTRLRASASASRDSLPDPTEILKDAEQVMCGVFRRARLHRIVLPRLAPPDLVGDIVETTVGLLS